MEQFCSKGGKSKIPGGSPARHGGSSSKHLVWGIPRPWCSYHGGTHTTRPATANMMEMLKNFKRLKEKGGLECCRKDNIHGISEGSSGIVDGMHFSGNLFLPKKSIKQTNILQNDTSSPPIGYKAGRAH